MWVLAFFIPLVFMVVALILMGHVYDAGYERGQEEGAVVISEPEEPEPTEPMVTEAAHNTRVRQLEDLIAQIHSHYRAEATTISKQAKLDLEKWKRENEKKIRADAIKRHKNVTKGKVSEHLIAFEDDFNYDPSDCRFLGSPIDIVCFDGLSEGEVKEVVFLEIKTGKSANLSTRERRVRDAIKNGKVSWRLIRKNAE